MTKQELIELLQAGKVDEFNKFREENPDVEIDLCYADLDKINLRNANLRNVTFYESSLVDADFRGACLVSATFACTDLRGAIFDKQQIAMLPELLGIKILED